MQAVEKEERLLKQTWGSGFSHLPKHNPAFSNYLCCIFFSRSLELKLSAQGHRFLIPKSSGENMWVWLMPHGKTASPARWQNFYSICIKHYVAITFTSTLIISMELVNNGKENSSLPWPKRKLYCFIPQSVQRKLLSQPMVCKQTELSNDQNSTRRTSNWYCSAHC